MIGSTIAAIATPPGRGGIAVIRLSGPEATEIANKIFSSSKIKDVSQMDTHTMVYGKIKNEAGMVVDECMLAYLKAPATYTGEDVVEISCHGSFTAAGSILELLLKSGATAAGRGEFTKRAFMNGKMDLSQAEAVIDIINSATEASLRVAVNQLEGGLSAVIHGLRDELVYTATSVQAEADFPEEGISGISEERLLENLFKSNQKLDALLAGAHKGRLLREGALCVIAGKPNVGKSSLLNALTMQQKAIVTNIPGTTRDMVEDYIEIDSVMVRIVDTAGLRESEDEVEKIGIDKTRQYIKKADIVLFVADLGQMPGEEDIAAVQLALPHNTLLVLNKSDQEMPGAEAAYCQLLGSCQSIKISASQQQGIDLLREHLKKMLEDMTIGTEALLSRMRHIQAVAKAKNAVEAAIQTLKSGYPADLVFVDLGDAIEALGEITGLTVSEEIVDRIFSEFCVGK